MKRILPLRQTANGYIYGIEDETNYIYIPFSKIEWFLRNLLEIIQKPEHEYLAAHRVLCSFNFDFPGGLDPFYADNYPFENEWDKRVHKNMRGRRIIKNRFRKSKKER